MITLNQKVKRDDVISGVLKRPGTGHRPHMTGAGKHEHRATKRCRTRSQQKAIALGGW